MKRRPKSVLKAVGVCAGAAAVSALLAGCSWLLPAETVYGPPPDWQSDLDPENNIPEDVYGPPMYWDDDYRPEEDLPAPVYGPPADDPGQPVTPQPKGSQP